MDAVLLNLSHAFTQVPFNRVLGLTLDYLDKSHVIVSFPMKDELIGNYMQKILHGGVISAAIDMTGGMAVMVNAIQHFPEHTAEELAAVIGRTSTVDLNINYLRPGIGEKFIIKAWLVKGGKKISFTRMELFNQDNTLIATGTGTYLLN